MRINKVLLFFYIVGAIVFFNALSNNFVWLDNVYITNSSFTALHFFELFKGHVATAQDYYRPVNAIYYFLLNLIFHQEPMYYHLIQISLYIYNSYLVFLIFRRFISEKFSFLLALLYLVHPLNEVTAVYVSASADVLYMFFGLHALLLSIKKKRSKIDMYLIVSLLICSILAKEMGAVFLFIIPLYMFIFDRKKMLKYSTVSVAVLGFYIGFRYLMGGFIIGEVDLYPLATLSFYQRLINIPAMVFYYIYSFVHPTHFGVNNLWVVKHISWRQFYLPLLCDAIFIALQLSLGVYFYRKNPKAFSKFIFFFLIFWVSLSVFLQTLIPLTNTVAPRWFYLPMLGLLGVFGLRLDIKQSNPLFRKAITIVLVIVICVCSYRTILRNSFLRDDITFFAHYSQQRNRVTHVRNNFDNELNLANAYFNNNDYKNALVHAQLSVGMFPFDQNLALLGYIYDRMGNVEKAREFYLKAAKSDNYSPQKHSVFVYKLTAVFFVNSKDYKTADKIVSDAVRDFPDDAYLWTLLAIIRYDLKSHSTAVKAIRTAQDLSPDTPFIGEVRGYIESGAPFNIKISPF